MNITKTEFDDYSFKNGFDRGDIMFLIGKDAEDMNIGDVIYKYDSNEIKHLMKTDEDNINVLFNQQIEEDDSLIFNEDINLEDIDLEDIDLEDKDIIKI